MVAFVVALVASAETETRSAPPAQFTPLPGANAALLRSVVNLEAAPSLPHIVAMPKQPAVTREALFLAWQLTLVSLLVHCAGWQHALAA